jgi:sugar-phosphatase
MDLTIIDASAIIFDLDGVLANSIAVLEESWSIWCAEKGLDFETVMRVAHGRRKTEILAIVLPGQDPRPEIERLIALEKERMGSVKKIAGAAELVAKMPAGRWAIATSGERPAALARLEQVGIAAPAVMISAEDVTQGKPNPEVYLKAAAAIGMAPEKCLAFEDAPAGIAAALAAGMEAVAVLTTYPASEFPADVPRVSDLTQVLLAGADGDFEITLIS